jgi:DNA-binding NarL/FixJ family response regulator
MKTLIVDDHAVVREGLKKIISRINKFSEIFEAEAPPKRWKFFPNTNAALFFLIYRCPIETDLNF